MPDPSSLPPVYGLDIETDTTIDGLDPSVGRVVAVAVSHREGTAIFTGDEPRLLRALDEFLADVPDGILATWNGCAFDLPYLATRADRHNVALGLRLRLDPSIVRHHAPLAGHDGSYRASWYRHGHLDGYLLYRNDLARLGFSSGLKAVCRLAGVDIIDLDQSLLHEVAPAALEAYVAADADAARRLVERRLPAAHGAVDRRHAER